MMLPAMVSHINPDRDKIFAFLESKVTINAAEGLVDIFLEGSG